MRVHKAAARAMIAAAIVSVAALARAEDTPQAPPPAAAAAAPPTVVVATLPIRLFANINLRQDFQTPEDRPDLLLDPNEVDGLVTRIRFGLEFKDAKAPVSGGLRLSVGSTPNPAAPFVRMGDGFRPVTLGFDQYYVNIRPLEDKERMGFTLGKMPMPFWRGAWGIARAEMTWDDDISPAGGTFQFNLYHNKDDKQSISIDNTAGYFIVEWFRKDRFRGLVGDTFLLADQLKVKVHRVSVAASYYDWENLNSGARAPSYVPGSSADLGPSLNAFLMRAGFQRTNAEVFLGPGAAGFRSNRFQIVEGLAQVSVPARLPWLGKSEIFAMGQYSNNLSVDSEKDGWGATLGFVGGDLKKKLHPYNLWGTWRDVKADAAVSAFADSDLGGGTDVEGFEISADYKITKNLSGYLSYFDLKVAPQQSTKLTRTFFGLIWDF